MHSPCQKWGGQGCLCSQCFLGTVLRKGSVNTFDFLFLFDTNTVILIGEGMERCFVNRLWMLIHTLRREYLCVNSVWEGESVKTVAQKNRVCNYISVKQFLTKKRFEFLRVKLHTKPEIMSRKVCKRAFTQGRGLFRHTPSPLHPRGCDGNSYSFSPPRTGAVFPWALREQSSVQTSSEPEPGCRQPVLGASYSVRWSQALSEQMLLCSSLTNRLYASEGDGPQIKLC